MSDIQLKFHVGDIIRKVRELRGMSQEELATAAEVHKNTIGRAEDGNEGLKSGTLRRIATALNLTVTDLYSLIPKEPHRPESSENIPHATGTDGRPFRGSGGKKKHR